MSSHMCPDCGERVDEDNEINGKCNWCHNGKYMVSFHSIDWTQLKQHFQTEEEIEAEFENTLRAIRGE